MNFLKNYQEFKNNLYKKNNLFHLVIVIIIFSLDRFSKIKVLNNFNDNTYYINSFINFDLIWNIGIGFGLLSTDANVIYSLITIIIALVITFLLYIFVISNTLDKFIYAIILGGALGNFYDRLVYKAVPDFIDLHFNNFHWFTFNVADIFISLGIVVFVLRSFFIKN